ncbi:GTPase Era [Jeotgalicoccus aerolatus]|uniref:GTPase Era n=1 Tax=Jeotgalicoccus aerolatus TaxID=709510 RepID=A0A1G8ULN9_9STAP|nr:GTPase Era [Jeotgalicoccus aerolatus]MBP1951689.1 GTP-binding protein Era [Jeotgalicoccus aerolatus]NMA82105.1 GTPase Era [Jeotgalicoccus aerolatus]CAD2075578.1 GTPase Era [Jeotgalicoccus aerolatus]SDJ54806.1 GTP-binding protein Era [Jeotgalicoccus aerolatus]GGD95563.1 GTPase Era [Jeotgalicoccus aerolatus]
MDFDGFKSGFVSIIGRPNVGKSTFMNKVLGQKVAIMSDKPQTTRNKIQGVYTKDKAQMIFIDTPGIHKPKHQLGEHMMKVARNTLRETEVILFIINAAEEIGRGDEFIIDMLKNTKTPIILVLNKIDLIHPDELIKQIEVYKDKLEFSDVVPISALQGNNIDRLLSVIESHLPEGPMYYPEDRITDHPEHFIVSELIREKALHKLSQELPHAIGVEVLKMKGDDEGGKVKVEALIYVERESQKGMVIGKGGKMLKEIGREARKDIENLLGSKVYLELWVKVQKDWRNKPTFIRSLGYKDEEY